LFQVLTIFNLKATMGLSLLSAAFLNTKYVAISADSAYLE
jgi:hypothetical protein